MNNSLQVLKKDLTSEYLAQLFDAMGSEHQLLIINRDGKMVVYLQKRGKAKKPEQIRLNQFLLTKPRVEGFSVKPWVNSLNEPNENVSSMRSAYKKSVRERNSKISESRKVAFECLSLEVQTMNISEADLISTTRNGNLYRFKVGEFFVYTKPDKTIVTWQLGDDGEMEYAPIGSKEVKPGVSIATYKWSKEQGAPVRV